MYLAEDVNLGRKVAVKLLSADRAADPESRKRFTHEARAQAQVAHANVAAFYEVMEIGDKVFIVMEYIVGQKLSEVAKTEKLALSEILDLAIQVGEGLQAAHEKGVMHRDINPANILVTLKRVAKITDFGLAKWKGASTITRTGLQMGTDAYMSPEQVEGRKVDFRTDIFSLGAVLYELICARRAFEGANRESLFYEILYVQPQPLARFCRGVPESLEQAVFKCLAKDPEERYQSMADLVADLKRIRRQVASGEADSVVPRTGKRSFQRVLRSIVFPLAGVVLVLAGLFLFPWTWDDLKRYFGFGGIPLEKPFVILPFTNVGGDPTTAVLCDGLGETVNSQLSRLEKWQASLRVVPGSDVRRYKVYTAEEARKIFGATLAVSGSVEKTGKGVRFNINLIDTKSLKPLRSAVTDYALTNVAAIPEWLVRKLAELLEIKFPPQALRELTRGGSSVSSASLSYLRGRGYLQRYENAGNLDMAIALFERALREDPLYGLAYAGLGEAYWRKYEVTKKAQWSQVALDNCTRAIQLDEQLVSAHLSLGVIHAGSNRYQNAIEEFQKVLKFDSLNVEAYRSLANAYQALGHTSQAETTYQKAIKVRPNYPAGYSHLGAFYYRQGRFEETVAQFERVIKLAPENHRGYNNLGGVYIQLGRPLDAEEMFKRSLESEPDYATYSNLGTLYFFEVARYADAALTYEKALELDSNDYRVWGNLASAYYWAPGERTKAVAAYERAAHLAEEKHQVNPQDATLLSHLSNFYAMLGHRDKALLLVAQSLALAPSDPDIIARAAGTYEQLGLRDKALESIGKALEKGYPLKTVEQSPGLAKFRQDGRFLRLAEEMANKLQN